MTRQLTGMLMILRTHCIRFLFPPGLRFAVSVTVLSLIAGVLSTRADDTTPKPGAGDFFESNVRPVLVEHCFQCHSAKAKSLKGGLRLDSFDAMRRGGDTGPAVVPGDVEASLLVRAVKYDDDVLRMPPKGKLPETSVSALVQWVREGAVGPHATEHAVATKSPGIDFESARAHWAYQPLREPAIPSVRDKSWLQTQVDSFVLASLESARITPSPRADGRTLIRRVYYDLIGLPPSYAEVEAFENDRSRDAFERVVDRLLASPHYGERWGRHWLDVARYADTKDGVLMFGDDRVRPYAYTYRDYVIRALNEDLGFDRFVHEQLAADLIAPKDQSWRLAAMGFLTLGRMFDNNYYDQIDDRIDTVTRGFLGLTVACARCHDHKYDAIPTADYYSLYGVFASSEAPLELPLIERPGEPRRGGKFEEQVASKRRELREFVDSQYKILSEAARQRTPDYLVHAATTSPDPLETAIFFLSLAPEDLRPQIVARWRRYLEQRVERNDPVFGPWHELMALADSEFPAKTGAIISRWQALRRGTHHGELNPLIGELLAHSSFRARADVARAYGELIRKVDGERRGSRASRLSVAENEARRQIETILGDHDSPAYFPKSQIFSYLSRAEKDGFLG